MYYGNGPSSPGAAAGVFGAIVLFYLICGIVALGFYALWVWMIYDCAIRRDWQNPGEQRMWILLLTLLQLIPLGGWIVTLVYYFSIKRRRLVPVPGWAPPPQPPLAPPPSGYPPAGPPPPPGTS